MCPECAVCSFTQNATSPFSACSKHVQGKTIWYHPLPTLQKRKRSLRSYRIRGLLFCQCRILRIHRKPIVDLGCHPEIGAVAPKAAHGDIAVSTRHGFPILKLLREGAFGWEPTVTRTCPAIYMESYYYRPSSRWLAISYFEEGRQRGNGTDHGKIQKNHYNLNWDAVDSRGHLYPYPMHANQRWDKRDTRNPRKANKKSILWRLENLRRTIE